MPKLILQFTDISTANQLKRCTSELSRLCKLLGVEFELYGMHNDFDIYLPESEFEALHVLNILMSYAVLKKIGSHLVP